MSKRIIKVSLTEVTFTKKCSITGEIYQLTIPRESYDLWINGELIQKVFPQLDSNQREFLKTGLTPVEWDKIFRVI